MNIDKGERRVTHTSAPAVINLIYFPYTIMENDGGFNSTCIKTSFSMKFDIVKSRWAIVYIEGSQVIISKKKMYYFF